MMLGMAQADIIRVISVSTDKGASVAKNSFCSKATARARGEQYQGFVRALSDDGNDQVSDRKQKKATSNGLDTAPE